jgi:hypothetical protein
MRAITPAGRDGGGRVRGTGGGEIFRRVRRALVTGGSSYRWRKSQRAYTLALSHHCARARPFFHLVFFHNSPRRARRRGRESTVAARRTVRPAASPRYRERSETHEREASDSFGQDRESVRSFARRIREASPAAVLLASRPSPRPGQKFSMPLLRGALVYCLQLNNIT